MANKKRLISADPIYNGIALYLAENAYLNDTAQSALEMVAKWVGEAPTVDAVEVVHGRWELHGDDDDLSGSYFCSQCGYNMDEDEYLDNFSHFKYCPNCGAKMDGERKCNEKETT